MKLKINEEKQGSSRWSVKDLAEDTNNSSTDYKIYELTMQVAVPNNIDIKEVGLESDGILTNSICDALEDRGLVMAGDWIDYTEIPGLTQTYKNNGFEI